MVYDGEEVMCMYLSFAAFMRSRTYRFNERLFESDMMYRAKTWKVHRREYLTWCEQQGLFNDYEQINEEVLTYEAKVLNMRGCVPRN